MADLAHSTPTLERRPEAAGPGTGRRSLFYGLGALALGSVPMATAVALEPDALLKAIGREAEVLFKRHQDLSDEWFTLTSGDDANINRVADAMELIDDRLDILTEQVEALSPSTLAGFRSKAVLARYHLIVDCRTKDGLTGMSRSETICLALLDEMIGDAA